MVTQSFILVMPRAVTNEENVPLAAIKLIVRSTFLLKP